MQIRIIIRNVNFLKKFSLLQVSLKKFFFWIKNKFLLRAKEEMCQFIQFWVNISSNDFMLDIHVIFCHVWLFLFFFCKEMEKIWMMKEFFWSQTILFCSSSNLSYHSQMIFVFQFLCMVPGQKLWIERKRLCKSEFYLMEWKFVNFKEWRRIYCILKDFIWFEIAIW